MYNLLLQVILANLLLLLMRLNDNLLSMLSTRFLENGPIKQYLHFPNIYILIKKLLKGAYFDIWLFWTYSLF